MFNSEWKGQCPAARELRESKCNCLGELVGFQTFPKTQTPKKIATAFGGLKLHDSIKLAEAVRKYHLPDFSNWKNHAAFARETLTEQLKKLAPYLELVANGDVGKLQSTGYDLRHDSVQPVNPNPLPAPANFNFVRGDVSGTMVAWADSLPGAGSYILQICLGDPSVEANWLTKTTSLHCSNIITDSYTPGKICYARMCGIGINGPGVWAVSPGVMVV